MRRTSTRSCNGRKCMHILLSSLAMSYDRSRNRPPAKHDLGTDSSASRDRRKIFGTLNNGLPERALNDEL
jgi:hypothetical protein